LNGRAREASAHRNQHRQADGACCATLNSSFTEAAQRNSTSGLALSSGWGKAVKSIAILSRRGVYEAIALAVFAGMVVLFVHAIVPLIAD